MNNQVDATAAQVQATARWVGIITLGALAVIAVFSRSYVEPYSHGAGPVILVALLAAYGAVFLWMRNMTKRARSTDDPGLVLEQMTLPVSTLALTFIALLACPAFLRVMG